ncbi:Core-2/I-branching beta-1,6-N-acetylglucosaminyltransferase family protein [Striga asiatica]|uniref:Core-2/I-branching beta-1,6-N-acetylglucosaminyltransferase family protein n=1 Tax=Striga asiatica TaxID=4170 RepID=A0A5A7P2B9_STRAF|nr:Core-2/I-branching beta-1,6-N-acetylglucosaminyltransferase family protein [Striga asiatica]
MNEREAEIEKLKLKNEDLVKLVKKLKKIVCILVLLLVFTILSKFKVAKENPSGMNQVAGLRTFSVAQMEKDLAREAAHTDICCCQPGFQLLPSIPDLNHTIHQILMGGWQNIKKTRMIHY